MKTRPKVNLTLSPLDNKIELAGRLFLIVLWGLALYVYFIAPATIPIHFNASGQANNYGSKATILILPIIGSIIYLGISQLNKYPHIFNYATEITAANAEKQYTIATRTLRILQLFILVLFSFIILFSYLTTIGVVNGLGPWFLPIVIALLMVLIIISITQSLKKKNNVS
jgi:uncharacterized membrane protein